MADGSTPTPPRAAATLNSAVQAEISNVISGITFEAQAIVKAADPYAAFARDFLERCSLLEEAALFDVRMTFMRAFPKDGFGPRGEWIKQVRASQASIDQQGRRSRTDWLSALPNLSNDGNPRATIANALAAFRLAPEWEGVLGYDEFAGRTVSVKPTPWGTTGRWKDIDDIRAAEWLQQMGILVGLDAAHAGAVGVAWESSYHPVRDYLNAIDPDCAENLISTWLPTFCGVRPVDSDQDAYVAAVGRRWLISAVARVFEPGCKADHVLVLEGRTGAGKSTALSILGSPWFSDSIKVLGNKDFFVDIQGLWIAEIGDMAGYSRTEIADIKTTLSSPLDHYRAHYGRNSEDHPRQTVFGCTTEKADWSKESTARRFWPVRVDGPIDTDGLRAAKDQLWCEALLAYRAGERWHLDNQRLTTIAEAEQAARYEHDPWVQVIESYVAQMPEVSVEEVLTRAIEKGKSTQTKADQMRAADCLKQLGWRRKNRTVGAKQTRIWAPPED